MTRKQLNIGLSPEQHALVKAAAEAEELSITAFCRAAILDRAEPEPEMVGEQVLPAIPAWLLHFLVFVTRRGPAVHSKSA